MCECVFAGGRIPTVVLRLRATDSSSPACILDTRTPDRDFSVGLCFFSYIGLKSPDKINWQYV